MKVKSAKQTAGPLSGKQYEWVGHFKGHLDKGHNDGPRISSSARKIMNEFSDEVSRLKFEARRIANLPSLTQHKGNIKRAEDHVQNMKEQESEARDRLEQMDRDDYAVGRGR